MKLNLFSDRFLKIHETSLIFPNPCTVINSADFFKTNHSAGKYLDCILPEDVFRVADIFFNTLRAITSNKMCPLSTANTRCCQRGSQPLNESRCAYTWRHLPIETTYVIGCYHSFSAWDVCPPLYKQSGCMWHLLDEWQNENSFWKLKYELYSMYVCSECIALHWRNIIMTLLQMKFVLFLKVPTIHSVVILFQIVSFLLLWINVVVYESVFIINVIAFQTR